MALLRDRGHTVTAAGHAAEVEVDLRFGDDVRALVERESPDLVVHLGGVTDPVELIRDPVTGNQGVVQPAVSVLEAVAQAAPAAPVLLGSCVAVVGRPTVLPVVESSALAPTSLYGAARAAVEYMAQTYRQRGVRVVVARIFDVVGPGASPRTLVGEWLARAPSGVLRVGDLELRRDFVDVRDVAAGLAVLGDAATRGTIEPTYNLCSGRAVRLADLLALVAPGARIELDPARVRRSDPPALLGSPALAESLGWSRRYTLEQSVRDMR